MALENLPYVGVFLIIVGILILIASIFLQGKNPKVEGGGFVLIGPFPIAFGALKSQDSLKILQIAAIALVIIYAIWLFFLKK